jgi:hypothetical protein
MSEVGIGSLAQCSSYQLHLCRQQLRCYVNVVLYWRTLLTFWPCFYEHDGKQLVR